MEEYVKQSTHPKERVTNLTINSYPAGIYLFKFNNGNTKTLRKNCSELTKNIPEQHQRRRSGVFIVNFEQIYSSGISIVDFELLTPKK